MPVGSFCRIRGAATVGLFEGSKKRKNWGLRSRMVNQCAPILLFLKITQSKRCGAPHASFAWRSTDFPAAYGDATMASALRSLPALPRMIRSNFRKRCRTENKTNRHRTIRAPPVCAQIEPREVKYRTEHTRACGR
jgi:hypothetical protein